MAEAFGLPVAPFRIAEVQEALIDIAPPEFVELGAGYVFASQAVPNSLELSWTSLESVVPDQQLDVIVFDWWARNQDRTFCPRGFSFVRPAWAVSVRGTRQSCSAMSAS